MFCQSKMITQIDHHWEMDSTGRLFTSGWWRLNPRTQSLYPSACMTAWTVICHPPGLVGLDLNQVNEKAVSTYFTILCFSFLVLPHENTTWKADLFTGFFTAKASHIIHMLHICLITRLIGHDKLSLLIGRRQGEGAKQIRQVTLPVFRPAAFWLNVLQNCNSILNSYPFLMTHLRSQKWGGEYYCVREHIWQDIWPSS